MTFKDVVHPKRIKNDSIVGMGLLLDANIIPIGKKMYPGNESEKTNIEKHHSGYEKSKQYLWKNYSDSR